MSESTATATAAATAAAPARRLGHIDYKWVVLPVVLLGTIMTILDSTIVNIAIPTLQTFFKVSSYNDIAWVVTGYLLAQGAVIPMTGWVTDRFGTKRFYLITIALFTIASMACGIANSLGELIFFRVLQGIGGGMLMPIGMTIILQAVGAKNMGKVMGIFGIPMLLAPALGPVLGGWFVQDFTWRLIFYVNVPIGIAAFVSAWMFLVESERSHKLKLDVFGFLTATPGVVALMFAVDRSTTAGWGSALVVGLLVASAVFWVIFVLSQLEHRKLARTLIVPAILGGIAMSAYDGLTFGATSAELLTMGGATALALAAFFSSFLHNNDALLHLELFKDKTFSAAMIFSFFLVTVMFGAMLLIPIYLQQVHHLDAITTALYLLPQAGAAAIAMPIGGILTDRIGPRPVVTFGVILLAIGGVILAQVTPSSSTLYFIVALALRGFAMGFAMMPAQAAALARIPKKFTSRASSITNTLQRAGSSIGIAVLVTVLAGQFTAASQQVSCNPSQQVLFIAAQGQGHPVSAAQFCSQLQSKVSNVTAGASSTPVNDAQLPAPMKSFISDYANNVVSVAFDRTFAFLAILSVIALIPVMFFRRPEKSATVEDKAAAFAA